MSVDVLFFFFKQKTAYEMRISDWSSDVCSSDLTDSADSAPPPANLRHLVARTTTERRTFDVGQPTPPTHPTQRHPGRTCDNSSPERRQKVAGERQSVV